MIIYDFEVFKHDWLVVFMDLINRRTHVIVNDADKLLHFYKQRCNNIFIGFNSRNYDQYIFKAILCGIDPYKVNHYIIVEKKKGYTYSRLFKNYPIINYDVMNRGDPGLKTLEGFMGNDIRETSVSFDIDRKLTQDEIKETIKYCTHDVEQTALVFLERINDFNAQLDLIKTFKLPISCMSLTKAQLTARALGCQKKRFDDEWEISFVPTIKLSKYRYVWDWYKDPENFKNSQLKTNVCGVPHSFGLGGVHGAPEGPVHERGLLIHVDVTSYYPSLMIVYDLLSRTVKDKQIYKDVYNKRVALKKAGKKKEQAPYKIILNSTYGITKDQYNPAYDPRRNHEVTINGQLLLLDLLEKLEGHCQVINSNTDGLIIKCHPDQFDTVDDICWQWEHRTGMGLGFDILTEIWQKDVNNYIFRYFDGSYERTGGYVKSLGPIDNDLPIINEAIFQRIVNNTPVEETIMKCDEFIMFQKIVKVSSLYRCGVHNGQELTDKTFRVFASLDVNDGSIYKVKGADKIEKFANTPERCFIWNDSVKDMRPPDNLDRQWYIGLAKKRLEAFGVT